MAENGFGNTEGTVFRQIASFFKGVILARFYLG